MGTATGSFTAPDTFDIYCSSIDIGHRRPSTEMNSESLKLGGHLVGHNGWVTQIATNPKFPDMILSASRDKTLIVWKLTREENNYGVPQKRLYGHSHFVSDVVLSSDGHFALSGSWDKTLKLWNTLAQCKYTIQEEGHTDWVSCVRFSPN